MSRNMQAYELKIRAVKRCIIRDLGETPEFKAVYVSSDIADEIKRAVPSRDGTDCEIGVDTTWETVPLKVDPTLRIGSVVYVW